MGGLLKVVGALVAVMAAWCVWQAQQEPPVPPIDPNPWWGPGERQPEDTSIRQFTINIQDKDIQDLKTRLALPLRLTPPLENANFTYGMSSVTLKTIVDHWKNKYDWRKREANLNKYPHFKTRIEGLDIHFMRASANVEKDKNVKVLPLLMLHGWPGSIVEFYKILPLLTTLQEGSNVVFEVICPSLPGYGFSQSSSKQGLGHLETSQIFLKLMKRLGYQQFYVQGGDWGSVIASDMATLYPNQILGVHLNMFSIQTPGAMLKFHLGAFLPAGLVVSQEFQHKFYPLSSFYSFLLRETGYMHIQATKPDTIGVALDQHPVSLAAYFLEKFSSATNLNNVNLPDGGLLSKDFPIPIDDILDNICIYWFTTSGTTSARFYAENFPRLMTRNVDGIPCRVPAGLACFPQELLISPKNLAAHKFYDIVTFSVLAEGGHFAALERPTLLAADVYKFVNAVENRK